MKILNLKGETIHELAGDTLEEEEFEHHLKQYLPVLEAVWSTIFPRLKD
jgi:hypothetical protein